MAGKQWSVDRVGPVTARIKISGSQSSDWEQWALITADRHLDNPHSDRKLQKYHLDQAVERGAFVMDFGDLFDAMQGKSDRRSSKSALMDKHKSSRYLNDLVRDAADFFRPYAANIALLSKGNHETGVQKHIEYDLLDGLVYDLHRDNPNIFAGGYRGWIKFQFQINNTRASRNGYWTHGYGGGGPVTKDIIQVNRKAVYLSNADYVFSGHTHDQWWFPVERIRLMDSGREVADTQHHVKIPTYKQEFLDMGEGFHHETGKPPKPVGAWWMRFYWSQRTKSVETQFIPADR